MAQTQPNQLPDPDLLARNLASLSRRGNLAETLQGVQPYSAAVFASRSGDPTLELSAPGADSRPLLMHSRYDPRREAESLVPETLAPLTSCVLFGGGLGYAALVCTEKLGPENSLTWIETDLRLFRTAIEWVDLTRVFEKPGVSILLAPTPRTLDEFLTRRTQKFLAGPIELMAHPASLRWREDEYRAMIELFTEFVKEAAVNVKTAFFLSRHSLRNQCANLSRYLESPGYKFLEGILAGEPALLVSAGPSLRRDLDSLKRAQGKIPMIAVSTALKPLLRAGVRPDFTCLLDYHRISKRYFDNLEAELAPPVVCDLKATPYALDVYSGVPLFGNDLLFNTLLDGLPGDRGDLPKGSTVAHLAFHFLSFLGADPIILVGQDLSYPGGLIHVPGTTIQSEAFPSTNRFYSFELRELETYLYARDNYLRVPATQGGEVPTDEVFFSYIKEFERLIHESKARVINATPGGARLAGTDPLPLNQVLEEFSGAYRPDFESLLARALENRTDVRERSERLLEQRLEELRSCIATYSEICELLERVIKKNRNRQVADQLVERVQARHGEIRKFGKIYLLLSTLAQSDGWRRIQDDRSLDAAELSGIDRQQTQAERDLRYVRALQTAGEFLEEALTRGRSREVLQAEDREHA